MYGIRRYKAGAWLATHLDRLSSHVISAIINIGQHGEPWPLAIQDLDGNTQQVGCVPLY